LSDSIGVTEELIAAVKKYYKGIAFRVKPRMTARNDAAARNKNE